jgi:inhibitor of cysteine peptidase
MGRGGAASVVALLVVAIVGCGGDDGGSARSDQDDQRAQAAVYEAGDSISVSDGQTFVIALEANPTTGYSWTAQSNANVGFVSSKRVSGGNMPGAPGTQRLTFRATSPGSSTLLLDYARPFEPGTPPAETESFPVTVKS